VRIAVDARELCGRPTGVGRYLSSLLAAWATMPDAARHEWTIYAPAPLAQAPALPPRHEVRVLPGGGGTRWEQQTLLDALRRARPDVLFAPGYSAPLLAPAPVLLTVHDVSFCAHPEYFHWREGLRRRALTRWSARRARLVATDSAFSRDEIVRHLGVPADRVRVVPLGIDPPPATPQPLAREPMVLYVGSIFARRHVDVLVRAFVRHVAPAVPGARLEIVGEPRLHPPQDPQAWAADAPPDVRGRIAFRAYVDDATLGSLYARASAFAFLSDYEGFGLTPLEALSAGVPPVVLDTAVAREVYGPAARRVAPGRDLERALGEALVALLTDDEARHAVLAHRPAVLARYVWRDTASRTLALLREAAGA
jgi:glycosyltransferase involved in cell wall biosynthesis